MQRYEPTDYAAASLTRIKEVANTLGVEANPSLQPRVSINHDSGLPDGRCHQQCLFAKTIPKSFARKADPGVTPRRSVGRTIVATNVTSLT